MRKTLAMLFVILFVTQPINVEAGSVKPALAKIAACMIDEVIKATEEPKPVFNPTYNVFERTNLTAEQLETIAPNRGQALYDMEQKHGINAVFCLAVGVIESGWKHTANTHNHWGITSGRGGFRAWNSLAEGIDGFGGYVNQKMYQGKTIEQIARIYCPPTHQKWARDVRSTMAGYFSEVER